MAESQDVDPIDEATNESLAPLLPLIAAVSAGALIVNLDGVVVNVGLDTLSRKLDAPISTIQWVVTAYVLALAAVVPLTGWASHRFGARRLWLAALTLFIAASALSGLAWSVGSLIAFRVLQGVGGGMILPAGHGIIVRAAGPTRLGRTMSAVNLPLLVGPILGPLLGGALIQLVDWRAIFLVNIPVCGAVLFTARRLLPKTPPEPGRRLDLRGLALLSPGLTVLVFGLTRLSQPSGLESPTTTVALVAGIGSLVAFVIHALRLDPDRALVDVRLFARRAFAAPAAVAFLFSFMMSGALVLYPLYWQIVRGQSPIHAGLLIGPQGVGSLITILFIGRMSDRYGAARLAPIGLAIVVAGTLSYTRVGVATPFALLAVATFLRGFGISFLGTPAYAAAYQSLSAAAVPRATTAYNIVQRSGSALGVACSILVLQHELKVGLPHVGSTAASSSTLTRLAASGHAPQLATAFGRSFLPVLIAALVAFVPAALLPWRGAWSRSQDRAPAPAAKAP